MTTGINFPNVLMFSIWCVKMLGNGITYKDIGAYNIMSGMSDSTRKYFLKLETINLFCKKKLRWLDMLFDRLDF